jgi:hypothetical protein
MKKAYVTRRSEKDNSVSEHWFVSEDGEYWKEVSVEPRKPHIPGCKNILSQNSVSWKRDYLMGFAEKFIESEVE